MKPKRPTQRDPAKVAFSVALPRSLVAQIEAYALDQTRSRNAQIEFFLKEAVAKWQREHPEANALVAEDVVPYDAKAKPADPVGEALRVRAGQPTRLPTVPRGKRPELGKDKA